MMASAELEQVLEMAERAAREPDGEWNLDILAAYGRVAGIRLSPRLRPRLGSMEPPGIVFEAMAGGSRVGLRFLAGGSSLLEGLLSSAVGAQVQRSNGSLLVTQCPLRAHFEGLGLPCTVFCGAMRRVLLDIYFPSLGAETARSKERCRVGVREREAGR